MKILHSILDLFFPRVCGICGRICKEELCHNCNRKMNELKRNKKHIYLTKNFDTHLYLFDYQDLIREKILQYKFNNQIYLYRTFVKIVLNDKKICGFLKNYDIIIPVPIDKKRKRMRGYNQSDLIAKEIAKNIQKITYNGNVLYKIRNTISQSKLNKQQRSYNLKNAYVVKNKHYIYDKKIILFDDIYTTGNTANECSKVLKCAGAKEIAVLTIAKD